MNKKKSFTKEYITCSCKWYDYNFNLNVVQIKKESKSCIENVQILEWSTVNLHPGSYISHFLKNYCE